MKKLILLLLVFSLSAFADDIDAKYEACIDVATTTADMHDCINAAVAAWDKELNEHYLNLMSEDDGTTPIIRDAQRKWLAYRDADLKIYFGQQGTLYGVIGGQRKLNIIHTRAVALSNYYDWLYAPMVAHRSEAFDVPTPPDSVHIDAEYDACEERADSSLKMTNCANTAIAAWDKKLNANYQELMAAADDNTKAIIRDAQRKWLAYRDADLKIYATYYALTSSVDNLVGDRNIELIRERAIALKDYYDNLYNMEGM
jgi:uncharacterized protein YecT (DUF1311 family)